ncbi:hypothetical protein [Clostridium sp.]|uniref:hypothetical protein n=1 Tax=Clostridium sp. TaxID=1506 RepID=UPI001A3EFB17|nr:hypothetical protein [Clostridium sp.]MBK5234909.1 hypothetical protein [Clostridium sp.]
MFNSSYHCLLGAKELQDDIEITVEEAVDIARYNNLVLNLKSELTDNITISGKSSKVRHLFDSALTPDSLVDYIETIVPDNFKCYLFEGINTKNISDILNILANEYLLKGWDVELYHQPLNPERIQTVLVEKLCIAFTVNGKMKGTACRIVDMGQLIIGDKLKAKEDSISKDMEMKEILLSETFKRINIAKTKHDDMEKSYIPQMDFVAVTEFRKKIIERIKKYI